MENISSLQPFLSCFLLHELQQWLEHCLFQRSLSFSILWISLGEGARYESAPVRLCLVHPIFTRTTGPLGAHFTDSNEHPSEPEESFHAFFSHICCKSVLLMKMLKSPHGWTAACVYHVKRKQIVHRQSKDQRYCKTVWIFFLFQKYFFLFFFLSIDLNNRAICEEHHHLPSFTRARYRTFRSSIGIITILIIIFIGFNNPLSTSIEIWKKEKNKEKTYTLT